MSTTPTGDPMMVRIENLTKAFGKNKAVDGLTFSVRPGEVFGLLGNNGAGKSTVFGMMLGQIHPDAGAVLIGEIPVGTARQRALRRVGAIYESPGFYEYLSGRENLEIIAGMTAIPDREAIHRAAKMTGIEGSLRWKVRTYSHGMRQRLALAQALLPDPELLLLDEPMDGLDPEGIHEFRTLIRSLGREQGMTVLLSSHLLGEVEQLCDRVAILHEGRLLYCGSWDEAGEREHARIEVDDWSRAGRIVSASGAILLPGGRVRLAAGAELASLVEALVLGGVRVMRAEPEKRGLEEFFLRKIDR